MDIQLIDEPYTYQNTTLEQFLKCNTPSSWEKIFEENKDLLTNISKELDYDVKRNITIYPGIENIFRIFYSLSLDQISLIIIAKDPYHNGSATGICLDVAKGFSINPSLRNIYTELKECGYKITDPESGSLMSWVKQGVFMLNRALTVQKGNPESYLDVWRPFTRNVLKYIDTSKYGSNIVYLLWGNQAKKCEEYIPNARRMDNIIFCTHPSPLSANRGFFGSRCFLKVNEKLRVNNRVEIDWNL